MSCKFQLAWICSQQRQNLNMLIVAHPDTAPSACCQRANMLENTHFIEAHKATGLKYQHVLAYNELFNFLHHSPYLLAQSLAIGDRLDRMCSDQMNSVVRTIATGLYGNVILSKDVDMVLRLLRDLIEIQIIVSDSPRRMLRNGSCSFTRLYSRLHESLFSAKLFLTAALHEPIMKALIGDEHMLDIDVKKVAMNYTPKERLRRFGLEGTDEYTEKLRNYHRETINGLYGMVKLFIQSLADNWALFPSTLRWVVQTMCHLLKSVHITDKDLNAILADMVFTHFICPAIVSPDLYGISDAPISENARFNLIQIGQILQLMAFIGQGDIEPKFSELFDRFDRNVVSELMDQLLETECDIRVSTIAIPHQNDFGRIHVLVTQNELNTFVNFFRGVLENDDQAISGEDRHKLEKILNQLPCRGETTVNGVNVENSTIVSTALESHSKTKQLLNLGKSTKNKLAKTINLSVTATNSLIVSADSEEAAGLPNGGGTIRLNNNNYGDDCESVLMIPITINEENKFQLLTEQEVLNMNNISNEIEPVLSEQNVVELDKGNDAFDELSTEMPTRKHTRFSLSQDDQSIGNSDNLEVVSEAPSNHSVTSSLELEENDQNLNDNLSDMVSANVSGRGTPNISGRDTPSSQVTDGDNSQIPAPQMAKILSKARSDIDDKFCKFEIKKLVEVDETVSIISDTWSTDVLLASDSETLEPAENERDFSTPLIPSAVVLPGDNNFNPLANSVSQLRPNYLDASDTRSESAWSTDVLASDSEKLTEVDTDDNQSIAAKSDITDAGRSEGDPIPDLIPHNQQAPDSPFFTPRNTNAIAFRAPDSPMFAPRPPDSPLFSGIRNVTSNFDDRRGIDRRSPRFPSDDYVSSNNRPKRYAENVVSFRSYHRNEADTFLTASSTTMRRQNSAESSISNQSSQLDDAVSLNKAKKASAGTRKMPLTNYNVSIFGDFSRDMPSDEVIVKTSTRIINPFADDEPEVQTPQSIEFSSNDARHSARGENLICDEPVEHRRISNEQRYVSFDGRRNGIMAFTPTTNASAVTTKRANSLNYENHEIIAKNEKTKSLQMMPMGNELESMVNEDDQNHKRDELSLVQKTSSLNLNDENNVDCGRLIGVEEELDLPIVDETGYPPPAKYTGAIPKSISFDASADKGNDRPRKRDSQSSQATNSTFRQNNSGGFFNKIKQGFKNRRSNGNHNNSSINSNKSANRPFDEDTVTVAGDPLFAQSTPPENGFNDTTEDILAKYRRKISSSSEATNSDSLGNNLNVRKIPSNNEEHRLSNILHDESIFLYSKAKQKLRLVLSTTDLHTADFRHTNVSPQSCRC